ncbi:hypothetical protein [Geosporobacter ferrireducens]|uniref:Uncharacterized protein n=1 Tax=Geosporobacter ferrireducens TaxID=1424294 RepID=A0A1D8GIX8_9FIRM|nr:hypothetical protein [Geosporobacter ferrireducens]AOT70877.1 hypothetical protein Gferi_15715 [Geosporobacter ferrireducens]MTI53582.1 hypothetical protein [Geosporobacter ferrireducens]
MNIDNKLNEYYSSKTCKYCQGLIQDPSPYGCCKKCEGLIAEAYHQVKEHLARFPGATLTDLRRELDIPFKVLHHLIKEGRISLLDDFL